MATKKKTEAAVTPLEPKARHLAVSDLLNNLDNPYTEIPKFKTTVRAYEDYVKTIQHCKFFYRAEPLVATVIDKLVEIGINDLTFSKNGLSDNEYRVFTAFKPKLLEFAEQMATEYLLTGLVVPEISYSAADKDFVFSLGVKKYNSLILPDSMWVRDSSTIKIHMPMIADKPSYFAKIPESLIQFINNGGKFADGKEDKLMYEFLLKHYKDFVALVKKGEKEILLENPNIFRRKYTTDNQYPIPYVASSLEALHQKRKLRRMDYSIIDKVISAIMHVKIGNDTFPITESDQDLGYVEDIRSQLRMRGTSQQTLERIFQLITNHTVEIDWVFPETDALLNTEKYADINQEILFGLGFPRVLITGEAWKSGTGDSEIATLSPIKTAENFRARVLEVIRSVCIQISQRNGFTKVPLVQFKSINLHKFQDFLAGLIQLYNSAAISRTSLGNEFGYDFSNEADLMAKEKEKLEALGLQEFGPSPNSKIPELGNDGKPQTPGEENNNKPKPTKKPSKPKAGEE
jgi:hypothetical protein